MSYHAFLDEPLYLFRLQVSDIIMAASCPWYGGTTLKLPFLLLDIQIDSNFHYYRELEALGS